jgi:hypothetical protein
LADGRPSCRRGLDKIVAAAPSLVFRLDGPDPAPICPMLRNHRNLKRNPMTYSNRSNAKRAADKMIAAGTAPATEYDFRDTEDGRVEIDWKTPPTDPTTPEIEQEVATADAEEDVEDKWPVGTRVMVTGVIVEHIDADHCRVALDGGSDRMAIEEAALQLAPAPRARRTRKQAGERGRRSKAREQDELAAKGVTPSKPDVTSHANSHYQKRFDKLAELAAAGDWAGVEVYQCNGVNTYAKMVRQYRDRLLVAHRATAAAPQPVA